MKYKSYYLLCLVLVILDQLTKQIVVSLFTLGESMVINSYLSWTYIQNTGAAFSILSGGGAIQKAFLLAVSLFVSLIVWFGFIKRQPYTVKGFLGNSSYSQAP